MQELEIHRLTVGPIGTNCYIVHRSQSKLAVIIDPGGTPDLVEKHVNQLDVQPIAILLTHGHFDHIGGVDALRELYPQIKVYAPEKDRELMESSDLNLSQLLMHEKIIASGDYYVKEPDCITLDEVHYEVMETPGHTSGSVCYYVKDADALFSGDTMFAGSRGRTDYPTGDGELLLESICKKLLPMPKKTKVYPGHNSLTTIGEERKWY